MTQYPRGTVGGIAGGHHPDPAETAVVEDCSHRLLQGVSLRALAAELRVKGSGRRSWSRRTAWGRLGGRLSSSLSSPPFGTVHHPPATPLTSTGVPSRTRSDPWSLAS